MHRKTEQRQTLGVRDELRQEQLREPKKPRNLNMGILYFPGLLRNKACHREKYHNFPNPSEFDHL